MTAHDNRHLNDLLHIFGAPRLGEGDRAAGANLLAAMATSIANIAPPGSGLQAPDGETLEAGASLLASGGHGTSLVAEKILSGLGDRQNNLNSHLRSHVRNHPDKPKAAGNFEAEEPTRMSHATAVSDPLTTQSGAGCSPSGLAQQPFEQAPGQGNFLAYQQRGG